MTTKIIPKRILDKLKSIGQELLALSTAIERDYVKNIPDALGFEVKNSSFEDILSDSDRSALHSFLAKLNSIPDFILPSITEEDGRFRLNNKVLAENIINQFRPIIFNQNDPTFYHKILNIIIRMLDRPNSTTGTKITVLDENGNDITEAFKKELIAYRKIIDRAIRLLEFDYLYNGVLQHAESAFSDRYRKDYHSGELTYLLLKHASFLTYLKKYFELLKKCASLFWLSGYPRDGDL